MPSASHPESAEETHEHPLVDTGGNVWQYLEEFFFNGTY
jgi:hypothetical protein